jgi:hypothetical protein
MDAQSVEGQPAAEQPLAEQPAEGEAEQKEQFSPYGKADQDAEIREFYEVVQPVHIVSAFGCTHLLSELTQAQGREIIERQAQGFTAVSSPIKPQRGTASSTNALSFILPPRMVTLRSWSIPSAMA